MVPKKQMIPNYASAAFWLLGSLSARRYEYTASAMQGASLSSIDHMVAMTL
jgi:hypothetical protein